MVIIRYDVIMVLLHRCGKEVNGTQTVGDRGKMPDWWIFVKTVTIYVL